MTDLTTFDLTKLQNGSDIRGICLADGDAAANLTGIETAALGKGFITFLAGKTGKAPAQLRLAVGRDTRITGPYLADKLLEAFRDTGAFVTDAGLASTPAMFMSTVFEETACDGAVMITASHLPAPRNGLKFFDKEGGLQKKDIAAIIAAGEKELQDAMAKGTLPDHRKAEEEIAVAAKAFADTQKAESAPLSPLMARYCAHLRDLITAALSKGDAKTHTIPVQAKPDDDAQDLSGDTQVLSGMHIVIDAGNGAGGFFADHVLAPLGCDISGSQFLTPDGTFPNHAPNPENKEAMDALQEAALSAGADLGIIFDTDVDRSAAVTGTGREVARNGIVALAATLIADAHPGATVVTDSITSPQLAAFLEEDLGLVHLRYRRGYKNVINKAQELTAQGVDCPLAIETSGHCALKENYFLDDGAYLATRIVIKAAQLKQQDRTLDDVLSALKEPVEATEVRMNIEGEDFSAYADEVLSAVRQWAVSADAGHFTSVDAPPLTMRLVEPNYEGVRIDFSVPEDKHYLGWCLLRKSLHDPLMPLNIESDEKGGAAKIAACLVPLLAAFGRLDTKGFAALAKESR